MSDTAEPLAAGRTAVRVRYPETDRMGVVYHAHYWVWYELGRTELMRELGLPYAEVEQRHSLFFPVTKLGGRYLAPARYDDRVTVRTRLVSVGGARMRFEYELYEDPGDRLLATGFTEHAVTGIDGRPRRLPAEIRHCLTHREQGA